LLFGPAAGGDRANAGYDLQRESSSPMTGWLSRWFRDQAVAQGKALGPSADAYPLDSNPGTAAVANTGRN